MINLILKKHFINEKRKFIRTKTIKNLMMFKRKLNA